MHKPLICFFLFLTTGSFCFSQENQLYLNRAWTFQSTNEFYIPLKFADSLTVENPLEHLKSKLDSAVVNNAYVNRRLLPQETATQFFDLDILQNVSIYTDTHELVTQTTLKQIEYYEDMIEGMFIAVFEGRSPNTNNWDNVEFYAISGDFERHKSDVKTDMVTKKKMDENIRKEVFFNEDNLLIVKHFSIKHLSKDILSILSVQDPETMETASYLFRQQGSQLTPLHQASDDYVIWDILPVPVSVNRMPVLLVEIVIPETDYTGYRLGVFNGAGYDLIKDMKWEFP